VVGGRTRCFPGTWSGAHATSYRWLRDGRPIAHADKALYRVGSADRGHRLACRVIASAGGEHAAATSKGARARLGLHIGRPLLSAAGGLSVALHCAAREQRCGGSLRVYVGGRAVAAGHFALSSQGEVLELARVTGGALVHDRPAVVRASYRNGAGSARVLIRRLRLSA